MKIDYGKIIAMWVLLIWSMCTLLWLTSCSAQHHLNKYQSKGGVCGKIDTIKVMRFDTLTNEYRYFDSLIIVNDRVVPLTRQEIRYQYRVHRDTIRLKELTIKEITKWEKQKTKREKRQPWAWVAIGVIILILLYVIKSWFHR
jgi:hypothetical protein